MNYVKHQLSLIILREVKMLKGLRNSFLVIVLGILISACSTTATKKRAKVQTRTRTCIVPCAIQKYRCIYRDVLFKISLHPLLAGYVY